LPPFETSVPHSSRTHVPSTSLPWTHSPIISSIAATVARPYQSNTLTGTGANIDDSDKHAPVNSKNANGFAADAAPAHDDDEERGSVSQGCLPPVIREKCSIL
jgi:hypothetical protein